MGTEPGPSYTFDIFLSTLLIDIVRTVDILCFCPQTGKFDPFPDFVMTDQADSETPIRIRQVTLDGASDVDDRVAVEEPMEIRVSFGPDTSRSARSLSITMRTPGSDFELAAGFLFTEGILKHPAQIRSIEFCGPVAAGRSTSNIVRVELDPEVELDLERLQRHRELRDLRQGVPGRALRAGPPDAGSVPAARAELDDPSAPRRAAREPATVRAAGVPMIVAVGAPSSLAIEMAERFGMTLIGFTSRERFDIYTRPERVVSK